MTSGKSTLLRRLRKLGFTTTDDMHLASLLADTLPVPESDREQVWNEIALSLAKYLDPRPGHAVSSWLPPLLEPWLNVILLTKDRNQFILDIASQRPLYSDVEQATQHIDSMIEMIDKWRKLPNTIVIMNWDELDAWITSITQAEPPRPQDVVDEWRKQHDSKRKDKEEDANKDKSSNGSDAEEGEQTRDAEEDQRDGDSENDSERQDGDDLQDGSAGEGSPPVETRDRKVVGKTDADRPSDSTGKRARTAPGTPNG